VNFTYTERNWRPSHADSDAGVEQQFTAALPAALISNDHIALEYTITENAYVIQSHFRGRYVFSWRISAQTFGRSLGFIAPGPGRSPSHFQQVVAIRCHCAFELQFRGTNRRIVRLDHFVRFSENKGREQSRRTLEPSHCRIQILSTLAFTSTTAHHFSHYIGDLDPSIGCPCRSGTRSVVILGAGHG
jgi:hypothetical protein